TQNSKLRLRRGKFRFQRFFLREPTRAENAKAYYLALGVYPLHYPVMRGFFHVARSLFELHFKIVGFGIEPSLHFFAHKSSPAFGLFVRCAVTAKASASSYLTTTLFGRLPPSAYCLLLFLTRVCDVLVCEP